MTDPINKDAMFFDVAKGFNGRPRHRHVFRIFIYRAPRLGGGSRKVACATLLAEADSFDAGMIRKLLLGKTKQCNIASLTRKPYELPGIDE